MLGGEKGGEAKAEPQRPPGFQSGAEAVPRSPGRSMWEGSRGVGFVTKERFYRAWWMGLEGGETRAE